MKNIWILLIFINVGLFSQSKISSFKELSAPEKFWVIFHPFKAKKAFYISKDAIKTTDSICEIDLIGSDKNGGRADAFKHSYWMARLTQDLDMNAAIKLGKAHEKGNYKAYKKRKLEDGSSPDQKSTEMDLFNNKIGAKIIIANINLNKEALIILLIEEIKLGKMKILKKDEKGNFLTCDGMIIQKDSLVGIWENKKCLISSEF